MSARSQSGGVGAPTTWAVVRARLSSADAIRAAVAGSVLAVFLPVVTHVYAFTDDYPILFIAQHKGSTIWFGDSVVGTVSASGRPLAGLADQILFSAAGTIENLRFIRFIGVLGIIALALLLHWALVRSRVSAGLAAVIAVLICSLPAFMILSAWTVIFNAPYAALLAGGASLMATRALEPPRALTLDRVAGATALLIAAMLIYQPAAMFYWVFLAIAVVGTVPDSRRALRLAGTQGAIAVLGFGLAFVVRKVAVHLADKTAPNASGDVIAHHPIAKLDWFIHSPLYWSANLFDLSPTVWLAALVATIATIGLVLGLVLRRAPVIPYAAIGVALLPLCLLPNLAVIGESTTYRMQVALSALIALYLALGATSIWIALTPLLSGGLQPSAVLWVKRLGLAGAVAFVAVAGVATSRNLRHMIVDPQTAEYRAIRNQVAALPTGVTRVGYVTIGWNQGFQSRYITDEFIPSSSQPWVGQPAVILTLEDEGKLPSGQPAPIVDQLPYYTTGFPKTEPFIDLRYFNAHP